MPRPVLQGRVNDRCLHCKLFLYNFFSLYVYSSLHIYSFLLFSIITNCFFLSLYSWLMPRPSVRSRVTDRCLHCKLWEQYLPNQEFIDAWFTFANHTRCIVGTQLYLMTTERSEIILIWMHKVEVSEDYVRLSPNRTTPA